MRSKVISLVFGLGLATLAASPARAEVSDEATCSTTMPACTSTRLNCCTRDFTATTDKGILIPLDRCHQTIANGQDGPPSTSGSAPDWCADAPPTSATGMFYAYGLVYRLMQQNIPVYWIVNPSKRPTTVSVINKTETTKDVDFWVLSSGATPPSPSSSLANLGGATSPIQRLTTTSSLDLVVATTYTKQQFPVRGGAFYIAPQDRAKFDAFWKQRSGRLTCGASNGDCYDFTSVYLYQVDPDAVFAWQDYTQPLVGGRYVEHLGELPVAMNIDYAPPRIARFYSGQTMSNWLKAANLDDGATNTTCKTGAAFVPSDAIGCDLTEADVQTGALLSGGFNWAWVDISPSGGCNTTVDQIKQFLTAVDGTHTAGNVMFSNAGIALAEQCGSNQVLGKPATGLALGSTATSEGNGKPPYIIRFPNNLFAQFGDFPMDFASGTVAFWTRVNGAGENLYNPSFFTSSSNSIRRLITQESAKATAGNPYCEGAEGAGTRHDNQSIAGCDDDSFSTNADIIDLLAYGRYDNDKENGLVFYSPGANVTQSSQRAQLKMILSSLIATPPFTVEQVLERDEVSRGSPIVATIGDEPAIVQGTYEYTYIVRNGKQFPQPRTIPGIFLPDDVDLFTFPVQVGHLRAITTDSVDTNATTLDEGTVLFDAAEHIPPVTFSGCSNPFTGSCRTVFTTITGGQNPANVLIDESHVGVLGPLMLGDAGFTTDHQKTLIDRVLKGYETSAGYESVLGGVDRSTVAVIGPGASIGATRPTIAYFGASDGMLHAVCASRTGACDQLGKELWAYVPRVNLSTLRYNLGRVDGSPHVLDVRGTFGGTTPVFKTVLLFHTGSGDPTIAGQTPAVYALDVTDPTKPSVLWEYTIADPSARGAFELGVGLTIAAGQATVGGATKNLAFVQTNNGGTAGPGNVVTALDLETGTVVWQTGYAFTTRDAASAEIPETGIPGGAVTVDKTVSGTNGFMTDLVYADLFGALWVVDPATGASRYTGSTGGGIPMFQFSTDFHPIGAKPAIYANGGIQYAVVASGGYADPSLNPSWGSFASSQFLVAASLNTPTGGNPTLPMTENTSSVHLPIKLAFGSGEAAYAQVKIVGDELFVATDNSAVNATNYGSSTTSTGKVYRINVATQAQGATATTAAGAGSVANDGTNLYSSSGSQRQRLVNGAAGTTGPSVTAAAQQTELLRKLWLLAQ